VRKDQFALVAAMNTDHAAWAWPIWCSSLRPAAASRSRPTFAVLQARNGFEKQDRVLRLLREVAMFQAVLKGGNSR